MEIGAQKGPGSAWNWDPPGLWGLAARETSSQGLARTLKLSPRVVYRLILQFVARDLKSLFRGSVFRRALGPLLFHRLAEAVAFAVHLEDVAVVRQAV